MNNENFYHRLERLNQTYSFSNEEQCNASILRANQLRDEAHAEYERAVEAVAAATAAMKAASDKHESAFIDANLVRHLATK